MSALIYLLIACPCYCHMPDTSSPDTLCCSDTLITGSDTLILHLDIGSPNLKVPPPSPFYSDTLFYPDE